jgi:hypothetical protein
MHRFHPLATNQAVAPVMQGGTPQKSRFAHNQYLVSQQQFTLPFYLFNGHRLIDGAVNGRPGKFLFDTSTQRQPQKKRSLPRN